MKATLALLPVLLFALTVWCPAQEAARPAELALLSGKIVTVAGDLGTVEALATLGDRILAVGTNKEIRKHIGPSTKVIDLEGKTAVPGFIDGHAHFEGLGNSKLILDLTKVESWGEVAEMVAAAAKKAKPGEWILGRGWHQEKWSKKPDPAVEGFPTHHLVSAASPDNPVCLTHASGHASFFNAKAMQLAGIDAKRRAPAGGEILKDEKGEPTGIFREWTPPMVGRNRQAGGLRQKIKLADEECLRKGVTSFQDAGSTFATIDLLRKMVEAGEIGIRLWVMIRATNGQLARKLPQYKLIGLGNNHLTVRAIKRLMDGALGSRGAWLLEPYTDSPDSSGLKTSSVESVTRTAELAAEHGFQLCVHAIGDRANREVLDIYEKIYKTQPEGKGKGKELRWRIEHAQHLSAADIPRFGKLGVIASMQGIHCTSDAPYVITRLGKERAEEGAYVWQKLMKSGALVTNGTDAPVEDVDPIACFHATVSRKTKDGSIFFPEQKMSRMEALRSYTINAATAAFEEELKGSLEPGKLADIVVLSQDIMTVPEDKILETRVLYTIVGGKVLYEAKVK